MNNHAIGPVVASVILIAVTVAVSIAIAAWMGALTVSFMDGDKTSFEYQIPTKYNATAISIRAQDIDATPGNHWSFSGTLLNLPFILKGETSNNTRIQISITYYITEQQGNITMFSKVGSYDFELLVRDISE